MRYRIERIINKYNSAAHLIDTKLIRFILVGCTNFFVSFLTFKVFLIATDDFRMRLAVAQATSYGAGLIWSFIWNRRYTFRSFGPWSIQFLRFLMIQLSLAGGSALLIWLIADILFHLQATLSWFVVMGPITVLNFYLSRTYVFNTHIK
jgi:putative flippase GtrA